MKLMKLKKLIYAVIALGFLLFILLNFVLYNHAYNFTNFTNGVGLKIKSDDVLEMTLMEKIKLGIYGSSNPKPKNQDTVPLGFSEVTIEGEFNLSGWLSIKDSAIGNCIIFHGYNSCKSSQINRGKVLGRHNYNVLLIDFRGHGDSEGFSTTIGFNESNDVFNAYNYLRKINSLPIVLMGTSMGAVSVLKSVSENDYEISGIIVECPFASLKSAVDSRFENLGLPKFILSDMLMFWGAYHTGIRVNEHKTTDYASNVFNPVLMIYGKKDKKVRKHEVDDVFERLKGEKTMKVIEDAAHDQLMEDDPKTWERHVSDFLKSLEI